MNTSVILIIIIAISISFAATNKLLKMYGKKSMRNMDIPHEINAAIHIIALAIPTFFM